LICKSNPFIEKDDHNYTRTPEKHLILLPWISNITTTNVTMWARLFEVSPSVCSRLVTLENMSKASGCTSPFLKTNRRIWCAITHHLEEKRWSIAVAVTFLIQC
jgi:hypothetical protein